MADRIVVDLNGDLDWVDFEMPGGNMPVALARLRMEPNGAPTTLVRFPDAFRRTVDGSYEVPEEFTVLEGTLRMSGRSYEAPRWVYVPPDFLRRDTHMDGSVLAVARFAGKARWHDGVGDEGEPGECALEGAVMDADSPFGRGRLLRRGRSSTSWYVEHPPRGIADATLELLDPAARIWAWIPAGEQIPAMRGPCIARIVEEDR